MIDRQKEGETRRKKMKKWFFFLPSFPKWKNIFPIKRVIEKLFLSLAENKLKCLKKEKLCSINTFYTKKNLEENNGV